MHFSSVILFCLLIVVVHSAAVTKVPPRKSAYAYLRSIRGPKSCSSRMCPFWERHGRSFAALRCYSREYQDCTCLHRMCFSSCMFSQEVCNQEMVSCLRQICPRCMPASSVSMCSIYDSMAERVAQALSVFACYPCCPQMAGTSGNMTTTPMNAPGMTVTPMAGSTTVPPMDGGLGMAVTTTAAIPLEGAVNAPVLTNENLPPTDGAADAFGSGSEITTTAPSKNQRVQKTIATIKRAVTTRRTPALTTRRLPVTTRRTGARASTVRSNPVKSAVRVTTKVPKKPQSGARPQS